MNASNLLIFHRYFHASLDLLARWEAAPGLRAPKKVKRVRKENRGQAPVEAPYVPPKQNVTAKSSPDKTIDIFEGMTILELAKQTGVTIGSLQEIVLNVGEKVDSEFDPISIDVAELVAMVHTFCLALESGQNMLFKFGLFANSNVLH